MRDFSFLAPAENAQWRSEAFLTRNVNSSASHSLFVDQMWRRPRNTAPTRLADLLRVGYVRAPIAPAIHGPFGHDACLITLKPLSLRSVESSSIIPKYILALTMDVRSVSHQCLPHLHPHLKLLLC
jgi:hypothetical protein